MNRHPIVYWVIFPHQDDVVEAPWTYAFKRLRPNWMFLRLTSEEECLRRLRQPSTRPRVVLYDDGHPYDELWHAGEFLSRVNESASPSIPVVVYTTGNLCELKLGEPPDDIYPGAFRVLKCLIDVDEVIDAIEAAVATQREPSSKKEK